MDEKNRINSSEGAAQQSARTSGGSAPKKKKRRKKRSVIGRIFGAIGTLVLVGVLTVAIFVGIFMTYVNKNLRGHVEVDVAAYDASVSSELYYKDPDTDEWVMYDTLFLNAENRIWITLDEIPKHLQKAAIAIEDERFLTHKGVDPRGILRAIRSTLTGDGVQGGSTITQQMIKNVTGDDENTIKRKVIEIYRAIAFEEENSKDDILEIYLNYIYMGESCYGVKTAAKMYFNKDVSELDLAESASLIAITNNPSMYDPLISDWTRTNNRNRQLDVLDKMLELGDISEAVYNAAKNEEIVFSNGYTCFGNYVKELPEEPEGEETGEEGETGETTDSETQEVTRAHNSYFTDQVIEDVMAALMDKYGYDRRTAENKVFSGCKIYTTQNINFQHICEEIFENTTYADYLGRTYGDPLQAAITLMDPYTGEVLAMVGGTGVKTADRGWNWATSTRQCGSAIKPVSTYAPALDDGTITMASAIDDYPVMLLNGSPYPRNSGGSYGGMTSVQTALVRSLNTCACRVNMTYGTARSYNFMTENLGFTTLTVDDSQKVGAMALGGLEYGVTTEEMAAAYCAFVNDGLYNRPYTFSLVEDADGNVLLENKPEASVAMKETTAYFMRQTLSQVVTSGTGYEAYFSGMSIAGKTGTTNDEYDRYFVGFSPYYCAAVWTGYAKNQTIYVSGNPSCNLWKQVMSRIHEGLEDPGFHEAPSGMQWVSVCSDSGLLATEACKHDLRGNRIRSVLVASDTAPTRACNMHKMVSYCTEGEHVATEYCPEDTVEEVALLDYDREIYNKVEAGDHKYLLKVASGDVKDGEKLCPVHNEEYEEQRLKEEEEERKKQEEEERKRQEEEERKRQEEEERKRQEEEERKRQEEEANKPTPEPTPEPIPVDPDPTVTPDDAAPAG